MNLGFLWWWILLFDIFSALESETSEMYTVMVWPGDKWSPFGCNHLPFLKSWKCYERQTKKAELQNTWCTRDSTNARWVHSNCFLTKIQMSISIYIYISYTQGLPFFSGSNIHLAGKLCGQTLNMTGTSGTMNDPNILLEGASCIASLRCVPSWWSPQRSRLSDLSGTSLPVAVTKIQM